MKTIIAGSRHENDNVVVYNAIKLSKFKITEVVSGCCKGVDQAGERYAKINNIPIKRFPADWKKYGNLAGPLRNTQMGNYAQALIAIWDGKSTGTASMIRVAQWARLRVYIYLT